MTFVLTYLLVLTGIAALLFVLAYYFFGRGEELPPLPEGTTATVLPAQDVSGADVDAVKFSLVFRGYKASEVDWVLDRLARQVDQLRAELREASGEAEDVAEKATLRAE